MPHVKRKILDARPNVALTAFDLRVVRGVIDQPIDAPVSGHDLCACSLHISDRRDVRFDANCLTIQALCEFASTSPRTSGREIKENWKPAGPCNRFTVL